MESIPSHVLVWMALQAALVELTLMTVIQTHVRMEPHAQMESVPSHVVVQMVSMVPSVKQTLMTAIQTHV